MKILIKRGNREYEAIALVNSGYEADTPQLMIATNMAKELSLWPPQQAMESTFETAGGPLKVWIFPKSAEAQVIEPDTKSKLVTVDIVVSQLADEASISDILAGELEISVEDFARGVWRFRWERERYRTSYPRVG